MDNRRVSDVRARAAPDPEDVALGIGNYSYDSLGDTKRRIRQLWREGKGPMAELDRWLESLGYRSQWKPKEPT